MSLRWLLPKFGLVSDGQFVHMPQGGTFCRALPLQFKKRDNHFRYLIRFIIVTFFGYVLSNIIIFIVMDVNQAPFWLATLIVALVLPPANWICNRYWAFNEQA